jgi:hypothetical protein
MSTISKTISEECSAVAFYGIEPGAKAVESFYRTVVQWFTDLGYPPDKVGITWPDRFGKLISFARGAAQLRKAGFEGVRAIEILASTPDALTGHGYFLEAAFSGKADRSYAQVGARSSLATLSAESMLPIARTLAGALKPAYGFGHRMPHADGPELYVFGMGHGPGIASGEAYEEERNQCRWGDMAMPMQLYRQGVLRDVYPWNFLTEPQLTRKVQGLPLARWIARSPRRGRLSPFWEGMSLWEVEEADRPQVREALWQAGVIFNWKDYPDE